MSVERGFEFTATICELEECDLAITVTNEAVFGRSIIAETRESVGLVVNTDQPMCSSVGLHETESPTVGAIGSYASRVVGRMKGEVLVSARAQDPVVFERVVDLGHSGLMRQVGLYQRYLVVVLSNGKFQDVSILEANKKTPGLGMVEEAGTVRLKN